MKTIAISEAYLNKNIQRCAIALRLTTSLLEKSVPVAPTASSTVKLATAILVC